MRRAEWIEEHSSPEQIDAIRLTQVSIDHLDKQQKSRFHRRKRAVDSYLFTDRPVSEICEVIGISRSELHRQLKRVFTIAADGLPIGYAALIPGFRVKKYRRVAVGGNGTAGLFTKFLDSHPSLAKKLSDWALTRQSAKGALAKDRQFSRIWVAFVDACREEGIDTELEYPFNSADRGREAVRRYCKQLLKENFVRGAASTYGRNSGRMAGQALKPRTNHGVAARPYHRVQLDGHRIDADLVVTMMAPDGDEVCLPLSRLWLLVLIDCASRAVLGYHISLSENYTSGDVLECVASALVPWVPKELPNTRIAYVRGAGLPSGVIEQCAWRTFNVLQFDNAFAHTSAWLQERIIETVCNEVITIRPARPRSDAIVERFMRTFEETSLHQWPNTTGSSPKDPKRDKPEDAAKRLRIGVEDLELATDLCIANYNASPHKSLNGRAPLEYLAYHIEREHELIRTVAVKDVDRLPLFQRSFTATVRGSQKAAHTPYVTFKGSRYDSPALAHAAHLIGQKVRCVANTKDLRVLDLFTADGRYFGKIQAEARWMRHPHSLRTRKAILKLIRRGALMRPLYNPVGAHLEYLSERAKLSRRDRNRLLSSQRESRKPPNRNGDQQSGKSAYVSRQRRGWITLTKTLSH